MGTEDQEQLAERKPTERVILREERVLLLPGEITAEQQKAIADVLHDGGKGKPKIPLVTVAWREVARHIASGKIGAIELHAGKPGTPDALEGVYRAPTVTSWKGAIEYVAPPEPLFERRVVD